MDFKENIFDKHIDKATKTIDTVQKLNKKVAEEFSESEHITTIIATSKSKLREINNALANIFLFVGIATIVYSFINEPHLYTNVFEYTKPDEYYSAAFGHFGYLFLYASVLLLIPIAFGIIKFSNSDKIKSFIIPLIILFWIFLLIYHQEFIVDTRWKEPFGS
jgi:cytochrome c biogenesis factor